ncbi:MAG: ATP-dependent helicase HrpB [Alcanivorax sp.]|nr:ATP-dependent helicase HrpB [Alcanivorax sp.]
MPPSFPADSLPIDEAMPALLAALSKSPAVVLQAPPGAGKTTRVPLALSDAPWLAGQRILMLEPRRMAARSAATYMARLRGEQPGQSVGYRTRLDSRVGATTRIEVVTEGILTRMLQQDPQLDGYGIVIFDEFHERSLQADLGLALARESQQVLRPDLRMLVMSATLDGERLSALLDHAPVVSSAGRMFPVSVTYRPPGRTPWLDHAAQEIRGLLAGDCGSVLVFLPGAAEIRGLQRRLDGTLPDDVHLAALAGELSPTAQDAAIAPAPQGQRKLVLSTAIAETSLTIEGVRTVVDCGWSRRPHYDPGSAMTRLITERVSAASATQRSGRAGRLEAGHCLRLWAESERLSPFSAPEIVHADLCDLVLELAAWGCHDPAALTWLDLPPSAAFERARSLLQQLGALDDSGCITGHGKAMQQVPLPVRLAHMLLCARTRGLGVLAAELAALLSDRDLFAGPLAREQGVDLHRRLAALRAPAGATLPGVSWGVPRARLQQVRQLARRLDPHAARTRGEQARDESDDEAGALLALAYPDRIALRRPGNTPRYQLSNGRGAWLPEDDPLAMAPWLVAAELDGDAREARLFLAVEVRADQIETAFAQTLIEEADRVSWDSRAGQVVARRERRLGALLLSEGPLVRPDPVAIQHAMLAGLRAAGLGALPWRPALRQWQARVMLLRGQVPADWPDVSDEALLTGLEDWAGPFLDGMTRLRQLNDFPLSEALQALLDYPARQVLAREAPTHVQVPSGSQVTLDYCVAGEQPVLAVKLQEMFGAQDTPRVAYGRVPVLLHLLSPARRPVAITTDLAGFWQQGYTQVRKDLRGRYPKHPWPEDPLQAPAQRGTGRRRPES